MLVCCTKLLFCTLEPLAMGVIGWELRNKSFSAALIATVPESGPKTSPSSSVALCKLRGACIDTTAPTLSFFRMQARYLSNPAFR